MTSSEASRSSQDQVRGRRWLGIASIGFGLVALVLCLSAANSLWPWYALAAELLLGVIGLRGDQDKRLAAVSLVLSVTVVPCILMGAGFWASCLEVGYC